MIDDVVSKQAERSRRELQERGKRRKPAVVANPIIYGEGPLVSDENVLQMEKALGEFQRRVQKQTRSTDQSHITTLFLHIMTGCLTGRDSACKREDLSTVWYRCCTTEGKDLSLLLLESFN